MPFHDLNVTYTSDHAELKRTLAFAKELEYSHVALSIAATDKLPGQLPVVALEQLGVASGLHLSSRITLSISDTTQNHRINTLTSTYDLVALRPTTDKALQLVCSQLECDIISLDLSKRLPFPIKFKTVASGLQRGIRFEICYSPGISGGNDARRNLIAGAASLIRATRGRGIILSSEARNAFDLRGPRDVINLAQIWGLSQERGKEAVVEEAARVVQLARLKRASFRGVVELVSSEVVESGRHQRETIPPLEQITVIPEKSVGKKRKADGELLVPMKTADGKPLSKREQKRQAKKIRLEKALGSEEKDAAASFPVEHESLVASELAKASPKTQTVSKMSKIRTKAQSNP